MDWCRSDHEYRLLRTYRFHQTVEHRSSRSTGLTSARSTAFNTTKAVSTTALTRQVDLFQSQFASVLYMFYDLSPWRYFTFSVYRTEITASISNEMIEQLCSM